MDEAIKFLEERLKYLDELIRMTPIAKTFRSQHRLVETQFILYHMLEIKKKEEKKKADEPDQHS